MGSTMSDTPRELLIKALGREGLIPLLLDGATDGRAAQLQLLEDLSLPVFVKAVDLSASKQPDHLTDQELQQLLG